MKTLGFHLVAISFMRSMFFLTLVTMALVPTRVSAALTEQITTRTISDPAFIVNAHENDGDATTLRNGLKTEVQLHFFRNVFDPGYKSSYRIKYQLKLDGGGAIKLAGSTKFLSIYTGYSEEFSIPSKSTTGDYNPLKVIYPDPYLVLPNDKKYYVAVTLQGLSGGVWSNIGSTTNSVAKYVHHFTQSDSVDTAYNIRSVIKNIAWDRQFLIDGGDGTNATFKATVTTEFARYDGWQGIASTVNDLISFDFDLFDSAGNSIPLENNGIAVYSWLNVPGYNVVGGEKLPALMAVTRSIDLKPTVALHSATESYRLECRITHVEDSSGTVHGDGNPEILGTGLLAFNGELTFGSILTRFDSVSNTPNYGSIGSDGVGDYVQTSIRVSNRHGILPANNKYVYGTNQLLSVKLYDDGHAVVTSGTETVMDKLGTSPVKVTTGRVRLTYGPVTLSSGGAQAAKVTVRLPQGNLWIEDQTVDAKRGSAELVFAAPEPLDATLLIRNDLSRTFGAHAAMVDESHPLVFGVKRVTVTPQGVLSYDSLAPTDVEYIHTAAYETLSDDINNHLIFAENDDGQKLYERASNDQYWRFVSVVQTGMCQVTASSDGSSRILTDLEIRDGGFETHFPMYVRLAWRNQGIMKIDTGRTSSGSALEKTDPIVLPYFQTCPDSPCGSGVPPAQIQMSPVNGDDIFHLTPNGGLYQQGMVPNTSLAWGARGDGAGNLSPDYPYAHRTDHFTESHFFASGYHLYAEDNVLLKEALYADQGGDSSPSALLLAGQDEVQGDAYLVYPSDERYVTGEGNYPGANFVVRDEASEGASRLGGNMQDYKYKLMKGAAKYYARNSGVFGRQVAVDGTFDSALKIYGYNFKLISFQQAFKASEQTDSWANGSIEVNGYCNFTQRFLGLTLNCVGELEDADLDPTDKEGKEMTYWQSEFRGLALQFEKEQVSPPNTCPVRFDGYLTMGVETRVAHVSSPLYGTFAFSTTGNLLTQTTGAGIGIDSELRLPGHIAMAGPSKDYTLVPTSKLRFSNPEVAGAPNQGFVTFGATINVPYFRDFQVQVMTSANDTAAALLYLTPGWASSGETFFSNTHFDPDHVGWPRGSISLSEYQSPDENTSSTYLIKAEQDMFGLIPLSYPMKWNGIKRTFASMSPKKEDLFIINVDHQVDYLDAATTKISFGAQYDGLPKISLANMLNGQIDAAAASVSGALGAPLKDAIDKAFAEFDKLLADSLDAIVDPVVDQAADDILRPLYREARDRYNLLYSNSKDWGDFEGELNVLIAEKLFDKNDLARVTQIRLQLQKLADAGEDAASMTADLKEAIEQVIVGIDCITSRVEMVDGVPQFNVDPDVLSGSISDGLLQKTNGQRKIVQRLVQLLLENLVEPSLRDVLIPLIADAASDLNDELNAQLQEMGPSLDQIVESLKQVRGFLVGVRTQIENAEGVIHDFNEVVNQSLDDVAKFQSIMERPASVALSFFRNVGRDNGFDVDTGGTAQLTQQLNIFDEISEDQFVDLVKTEIKDALIQSDMIQQYKYLLRQLLYDVQGNMQQTVSTVLSEITGVMKKLISKTAGKLDEKIAPMLGKVNEYMGTANVVGNAQFNGDSLRRLRMDAELQIKVPDDMKLNVFMEVNAYTSEDAAGGCLVAGEKAVEVTIGATDVSCGWISEGLRANLTTKMSLKDDGSGMLPNGLGGGFELTGGEIDFQSFKITEFGATLAVGGDACYLGAKAHGIFNSYELGLGVFFGRTCTVDPLVLVDEDVGSLFKPQMMPLTGAYVYGEVWLPISELALGIPSSCMFSISAGVGTGIGFFLDDSLDPTFVAKMYAGISGEALCVVSIKGEVTMVGVVRDGSFSAKGKGKLKGKAGACPFCIKFSTTATISYSDGDWDVDY